MKTIISPSLLSCDFLNIREELKILDCINDIWLHLDIMDGHFVKNLTFGHPIVKKIAQESKTPLDAHFMVTNPEFYIETFKDYKIHNFTFHLEATPNHLDLIKKAKSYYPSVGLSIKPLTETTTLSDDILKHLDLVLVMSVDPGFGGQAFIENTYKKVEELDQRRKKLNLNFAIQVDGGINDKNSSKLLKLGANNLVAGSFVFKDGPKTYSNIIDSLRSSI